MVRLLHALSAMFGDLGAAVCLGILLYWLTLVLGIWETPPPPEQ
jgi:hypothetical protein